MKRNGRSERIRTSDPLVPNQMRYQAAPRSEAPLLMLCWGNLQELNRFNSLLVETFSRSKPMIGLIAEYFMGDGATRRKVELMGGPCGHLQNDGYSAAEFNRIARSGCGIPYNGYHCAILRDQDEI